MENGDIITREFMSNILYGNFKISTLMKYCAGLSPYETIDFKTRIEYLSGLILHGLSFITNKTIENRFILVFGQILARLFGLYYKNINKHKSMIDECGEHSGDLLLKYMCIKKYMYADFNPIFKLQEDEKLSFAFRKRLTGVIIPYQRKYLKIMWNTIFSFVPKFSGDPGYAVPPVRHITSSAHKGNDFHSIREQILSRQASRKTASSERAVSKTTNSSFKIRRFIKLLKRNNKSNKKLNKKNKKHKKNN